jgi:hypothetical protein
VAKIVSELGFRFRPSSQADLETHAHTLRLLTEDLADVPVSLLDEAARRWALSKPFLPKASELVALAKEVADERTAGTGAAGLNLQAFCDRMNASNGPLYYYVAGEAPHRRVDWKLRGA